MSTTSGIVIVPAAANATASTTVMPFMEATKASTSSYTQSGT
jgi:hypothetical protein